MIADHPSFHLHARHHAAAGEPAALRRADPRRAALALPAARARRRGHRLASRTSSTPSPRELGASVLRAALLALRHRPEPAVRQRADVPGRQQHRAVPDALLHAATRSTRRRRARRRREIARRIAQWWRPYHGAHRRPSSRACAPRTATRCCSTATASRASCPGCSRAACPTSTSAPSTARAARRRCATRWRACSRAQERLHATSSTAASRAATSRATTAGPHDGVHAVQLEMTWRLLHGRDAARTRTAPTTAAQVQPLLRALLRHDARLDARDGAPDDARRCSGRPPRGSPAAGSRRRAAAHRRRRPLVARSPPACAAAARRASAWPARCCPASSTRTATRSSAPSPAWPSGASGDERRLLELARPHVRGRATPSRPSSLRAIAAQLYVELLRGGYTQVCEFHYLQHRPDGSALRRSAGAVDGARRRRRRRRHRPDAAAGALRARRLHRAVAAADQRRFHAGARDVWQRSQEFDARVAAAGRASLVPLNAGLAIHSVRAAARRRRSTQLRQLAHGFDGPIHVHVVRAARRGRATAWRATGQTPVAWLARRRAGSTRAGSWCTRRTSTPAEIDADGRQRRRRRHLPGHRRQPRRRLHRPARAGSAAGVDLVDRLGQQRHAQLARGAALDGIRPAPAAGAPQRRAPAAHAAPARPSTRASAACSSAPARAGRRAAGHAHVGPRRRRARRPAGDRSATTPACCGLPPARWLDALVFSSPAPAVARRDGGRALGAARRRARARRRIGDRFEAAMRALWP